MIVAIIQARMTSSRLPEKVILKLDGKEVVLRVYDRVKQSQEIDKVIVATSNNASDSRIKELCERNDIECFVGNEEDVLDRYFKAVNHLDLEDDDIIVRITADCPLIDHRIIDEAIRKLKEGSYDYVSNVYPSTYPDGLDVEVFSYAVLKEIWWKATLPSEREHVTLYLQNNIEAFSVANIESDIDYSYYRWTLDEREDFIVLEQIYRHFQSADFSYQNVIDFLKVNDNIANVNKKYSRNQGTISSYDKDKRTQDEVLFDTLNEKVVLVTGGTGSFGNKFIEMLFVRANPKKIIIYSRDEYKQFIMKKKFNDILSKDNFLKLRFFIGDVRDVDRLETAFEGVDYVIHAAAMKQVPACEYNPFEAVKTNIHGAQNVIMAALKKNVKKVVALSTDKSVNPINLYGGTKLVSDKLFVSANAYSGTKDITFSVVRYGNVAGSRGSVIPFFEKLISQGVQVLPITDYRMTRFWITLEEGVELVFKALKEAKGGETYISKIPSFKITDLAKAMSSEVEMEEVGIREGEKLHEIMITKDDSRMTFEYDNHYIIYPNYDWWDYKSRFLEGGKPVGDIFDYRSDNNLEWLTVEDIAKKLELLEKKGD